MKTQIHDTLISTLPEGFTVRGATLEDAGPAVKLFNRWSQALILLRTLSSRRGRTEFNRRFAFV